MRRLGDEQHNPRTGMTKAMEAAERIKQFIATSGLRPGDCLPSKPNLCDSLGVSRSSLREVVRTLNTPEIVKVQYGRGAFVGNAILRPLVETLVFRMNMFPGKYQYTLLEVAEVRRGIDLGEAEQVCFTFRGTGDEELHWLVDRIIEATGEGRPFVELDRGFHVTLMNRTDRRIITDLVVACWDIQTMTLAELPPSTVTDLLGTHVEILRAAEAGDVDGYR